MNSIIRRRIRIVPLISLCMSITLMGACENPVKPGTEHLEAVEVQLSSATDSVLALTRDNLVWSGGPIRMVPGEDRKVRVVFFDVYNAPFTLEGRTAHTLRGEIETTRVATWTTVDGHGAIRAIQPGVTRIRFHIWHVTHADFTSPWLELRIVSEDR